MSPSNVRGLPLHAQPKRWQGLIAAARSAAARPNDADVGELGALRMQASHALGSYPPSGDDADVGVMMVLATAAWTYASQRNGSDRENLAPLLCEACDMARDVLFVVEGRATSRAAQREGGL